MALQTGPSWPSDDRQWTTVSQLGNKADLKCAHWLALFLAALNVIISQVWRRGTGGQGVSRVVLGLSLSWSMYMPIFSLRAHRVFLLYLSLF